MNKTAYIECKSGASGDMILGALLDLGLPLSEVEKCVLDLKLTRVSVVAENVIRGGIRATRLIIDAPDDSPARNWAAVKKLIENSALDSVVKEQSLKALRRLAETEGAIHGVEAEKVHFHELSGVDSLIDICGAFTGFKFLGIGRVVASAVNVGSGTVKCEHGTLPVPAPATAELLKGVPIYSSGDGELTTPTGALLLTELASGFGDMPVIKVDGIGCGAGTKDGGAVPNVVRIFIGDAADTQLLATEQAIRVQTNIDDMNPQIYPYLIDKLLAGGALDAWMEQCVMKKGRPGVVFNILVHPDGLEAAFATLISETTTLGVRLSRMERLCIERSVKSVKTRFGDVRIKIGVMDGKVANVMPEYEDCAAAARVSGAPLSSVMDEARAAALAIWKLGGRFEL